MAITHQRCAWKWQCQWVCGKRVKAWRCLVWFRSRRHHHEHVFCDVVTSEPQTALDTVTDLNTNSLEIGENGWKRKQPHNTRGTDAIVAYNTMCKKLGFSKLVDTWKGLKLLKTSLLLSNNPPKYKLGIRSFWWCGLRLRPLGKQTENCAMSWQSWRWLPLQLLASIISPNLTCLNLELNLTCDHNWCQKMGGKDAVWETALSNTLLLKNEQ